MAEEKKDGGPNWLLGIDKLTTPTLDYFGVRLRDKLRTYFSQRAKERAALRRFEKDFLYRQLDLLHYGGDQFADALETLGERIMDMHFEILRPLMQDAIHTHGIQPDRAIECLVMGHTREPVTLAGGELVLYSAAAAIMDILVAIHSTKMLFHYSHLPAAVQLNNPDVADDELQRIMEDPEIQEQVSHGVSTSQFRFTKRCAKTLAEIYGFEFNEAEWDANELAESNPAEEPGKD